MADDLKYGYKGAEPTQSFGSNTGVFDPADINNLVKDDKWTNYGQLELIETQTVSGVTEVDFLSIDESIYNVHFVTINDLQGIDSTASPVYTRLSNDGGTTFETSNYQRAHQINTTESKTTSSNFLNLIGPGITNKAGRSSNCYIYFYNLGDSSKYSFATEQSTAWTDANAYQMHFGSSVYTVAETINAIRFYNASSRQISGTISLYGIRYS